MARAREVIRQMGAERCNTFSMFFLACLGQVPWRAVPAIPPELILLPRWFYFHLTKISAWTRAMIVPLAIVVTLRPTRHLTASQGIDELFVDERQRRRLTPDNNPPWFWKMFFMGIDRGLMLHHIGGTPFRRHALKACEESMLKRASQDDPAPTEGLGIFQQSLQIALKKLGRLLRIVIQRPRRISMTSS